jgi:hypothetical protein
MWWLIIGRFGIRAFSVISGAQPLLPKSNSSDQGEQAKQEQDLFHKVCVFCLKSTSQNCWQKKAYASPE